MDKDFIHDMNEKYNTKYTKIIEFCNEENIQQFNFSQNKNIDFVNKILILKFDKLDNKFPINSTEKKIIIKYSDGKDIHKVTQKIKNDDDLLHGFEFSFIIGKNRYNDIYKCFYEYVENNKKKYIESKINFNVCIFNFE